jgi:hypothetical protein
MVMQATEMMTMNVALMKRLSFCRKRIMGASLTLSGCRGEAGSAHER